MIQVTQKQAIAGELSAAPDRTAARRGARADFRQLFQTKTAAAAQPPAKENRAAAQPPAEESRAAAMVQTAPAVSDEFVSFAPSAIEAKLNRWLMGMIDWQNQKRIQIYNNAVENWKLNSAHHRELGLPELPPPDPPVLEAVEPMPDGWWSQIHS